MSKLGMLFATLAGAEVMMMSVAALVELFTSPYISPVTVPGVLPIVLVNVNVKSSALAVGEKKDAIIAMPIPRAGIAVFCLRNKFFLSIRGLSEMDDFPCSGMVAGWACCRFGDLTSAQSRFAQCGRSEERR